MTRGRKPDLSKSVRGGSVSAIRAGMPGTLPNSDEPNAAHISKADRLRPDELNKLERKVWNRLAPQLVMLGRLKPHFVDALADYCSVHVRLGIAREYLNENEWSYVTKGRNGEQSKMRPEVGQLNDDWKKMRSLRGDFGLTPVAERGLSTDQPDLFDDGWGDI